MHEAHHTTATNKQPCTTPLPLSVPYPFAWGTNIAQKPLTYKCHGKHALFPNADDEQTRIPNATIQNSPSYLQECTSQGSLQPPLLHFTRHLGFKWWFGTQLEKRKTNVTLGASNKTVRQTLSGEIHGRSNCRHLSLRAWSRFCW